MTAVSAEHCDHGSNIRRGPWRVRQHGIQALQFAGQPFDDDWCASAGFNVILFSSPVFSPTKPFFSCLCTRQGEWEQSFLRGCGHSTFGVEAGWVAFSFRGLGLNILSVMFRSGKLIGPCYFCALWGGHFSGRVAFISGALH